MSGVDDTFTLTLSSAEAREIAIGLRRRYLDLRQLPPDEAGDRIAVLERVMWKLVGARA